MTVTWDRKRYPPKAVTACETAAGQRVVCGDFEGGRPDAVRVPEQLAFDVRPRRG